jgi:hypothetical protein
MRYLEKVGMAPYINAKPRQISKSVFMQCTASDFLIQC